MAMAATSLVNQSCSEHVLSMRNAAAAARLGDFGCSESIRSVRTAAAAPSR